MTENDDRPIFGVAATLTSGERSLPTGIGWTGGTFDDEADDLVGQTLCNTYVIESVLGEGGMGRVYLATHTRIRRKRLAIKVLHPEYLRKPDVVRRFQREAEAAASIVSEHVVGVYDVDVTPDGRPFLVAELLDGIELGELLDQQGRLSIPYAVRIVRQICDAITAAHAQGVVHRDMKPENVFLTGRMELPHVKVLDFGISRLEDEGTKLTQAGTVMGTPAYMPPEQARGEHVDHRADIYSVGAVLYRALTGHAPFERDDPLATMAAVFTEEPPRPRAFEPSIPEHLEAIIQRSMAKKSDQRHASMAELSAALEPYDTGVELAQAGMVASVARDASDARTQLVLLLVAMGVLGVGGLVSSGTALLRLIRASGPTAAELAVVLGCVTLAAITPMVLALRQLRRTVWSNSARVVDAVETVRRPLVAAVAIYGAGWLLVGLLGELTLSARAHWPGWWVLLFFAAAVTGVVTYLARRPGSSIAGSMKSPLLATIVSFAGLGFVLVVGLAAYDRDAIALFPAREGASSEASDSAIDLDESERASEDELEAARDDGASGLEKLAEKYPKDPAVQRALVLEHADTATGLTDAMKAAKKLAEIDPKALEDEEILEVVNKAVDSVNARAVAIDIMAEHMGSKGIDLLWEIAHGTGGAKTAAAERLREPAVRARGTPALRIAADIEAADGCADKAALLDRAAADGDERTVAQLQPLTVTAGRGCGFLGLSACPARCAGEAAKMKEAIAAIEKREER